MNLIFQFSPLILIVALSSQAKAIEVDKCPKVLEIQVGQPSDIEDYAKAAYEKYFSNGKVVSAQLNLSSTRNSECVYEAARPADAIFSASITGSLRSGALHPASLAVYAELPVGSSTDKEIEIKDIVVYAKIATLSPFAVTLTEKGRLYRRGEVCSYGECAAEYISMGKFNLLKVKAL